VNQIFLLCAAIYIWPQLNVANKSGVFKVVFGFGKVIYRADDPTYYKNIMALWRTTVIICGIASVTILVFKYVVWR
jgi:hypothetical protein